MPSATLLPSIDLTDDQAVADVDLFLDRRMVAIVFVDIASSTSRLVQMTDRAWCSVLDSLDEALEQVVSRLGGTISNRMGDGYLVVFDGVSRAVRFGEMIHRVAETLDLELRVGIHAGEIEQQGEQIAGVAVHCSPSPGSGRPRRDRRDRAGHVDELRQRARVPAPRRAGAPGSAGPLAPLVSRLLIPATSPPQANTRTSARTTPTTHRVSADEHHHNPGGRNAPDDGDADPAREDVR